MRRSGEACALNIPDAGRNVNRAPVDLKFIQNFAFSLPFGAGGFYNGGETAAVRRAIRSGSGGCGALFAIGRDDTRMKKIGFIGLGNMGLPMAANLVKAGFEVYGLNRSKGAEAKLAAAGGRIGLTRARLAAEMDLIVTCLPMPADVEDVYTAPDGLIPCGRPGLLLADCSTVGPDLNRRLYEAASARGIAYLDAPVSGGTAGAQAGTLSVMTGGDKEAFERARPAFRSEERRVGKECRL